MPSWRSALPVRSLKFHDVGESKMTPKRSLVVLAVRAQVAMVRAPSRTHGEPSPVATSHCSKRPLHQVCTHGVVQLERA